MAGTDIQAKQKRSKPTPMDAEEYENEMISLSMAAARKQLLDGTASSQVITHFLKLGSSRERIEQRNKSLENELLVAKRENLEQAKRIEDLYSNAISAFREYNGDFE